MSTCALMEDCKHKYLKLAKKKNHVIADINSFLIFERASKHTVYSCLSRTSGVKYVMVCCWYGQQVDWLEQKPTKWKRRGSNKLGDLSKTVRPKASCYIHPYIHNWPSNYGERTVPSGEAMPYISVAQLPMILADTRHELLCYAAE